MRYVGVIIMLLCITAFGYGQNCLPSASYQPDSAKVQKGRYYHKSTCEYKSGHTSRICYYDGRYIDSTNKFWVNGLGLFRINDPIVNGYGFQGIIFNFYLGLTELEYNKISEYTDKPECISLKSKNIMIRPPDGLKEREEFTRQYIKIGYAIPVLNKHKIRVYAIPQLVQVNESWKYTKITITDSNTPLYKSKTSYRGAIDVLLTYKWIGVNFGSISNKSYIAGLFFVIN